MADINYMPISEFVDLGLLHEINRLLLHPMGLALQIVLPVTETSVETLIKVWDYRDDPEGMYFAAPTLDPEKAKTVCDLLLGKRDERKQRLGYIIQPIPDERVLSVAYTDPELAAELRGER